MDSGYTALQQVGGFCRHFDTGRLLSTFYFSADGEPHITISSLVLVDHKGTVLWQPPSIYKSLCPVGNKIFFKKFIKTED